MLVSVAGPSAAGCSESSSLGAGCSSGSRLTDTSRWIVELSFITSITSPMIPPNKMLPTTQLLKTAQKKAPQDFKQTNVYLTFEKEWIKHKNFRIKS